MSDQRTARARVPRRSAPALHAALALLVIGCGAGGEAASDGDPTMPTTPTTPATPTTPDHPLGTISVAVLPAGAGVWTVEGVGADGRIYGTVSSVVGGTPRLVVWGGDYAAPPAMGPESSRTSAARPNDIGGIAGDSARRYGVWSTTPGGSITFSAVNTGAFTDVMTRSVNDRGQIVGFGRNAGGRFMALFWAGAASTPVVLPSPQLSGTLDNDAANAINANGDVAGWVLESRSGGSITFQRPVLWKNTGSPASPSWSTAILEPTAQAAATDVNVSGVVVGVRGQSDATIWMPVSTGYGRVSVASGESATPRLDRCGRSVGSVTTNAYVSHGGAVTILPLPEGVNATSVTATGITTLTNGPFAGRGMIVGFATPNLPLRWMIDGCP